MDGGRERRAAITIVTSGGRRPRGFTHRWTFADEAVRRVAGYSTRATVSTRSSFTAIKHLITTLPWATEAKKTMSVCSSF